jgi:hypothetical protein
MGFVDAGYAASGDIQQPSAKQVYDRLRRLLEAELPAADIHACAAQGAGWSDMEAVALAFDRIVSPGAPATESSRPAGYHPR